MNTPEPTAAARRAQENLVRKQAAGRLGAALMMVALGFGLLVFWVVIAGIYIEDQHWYQGPRWNGFKRDAMHFVEEPLLAIMTLHLVLVLSAWYFGRMAGIHVFYRGKRTFGVSAACTYASIWPALILVVPIITLFIDGWEKLATMFKYYSNYGFQIAGLLTMMNFMPALLIGGLLAILLSQARKRQGEGLRMLEVEAVIGGAAG